MLALGPGAAGVRALAEPDAAALRASARGAGVAAPAPAVVLERTQFGSVAVDPAEAGFRAVFPAPPHFESVREKTLLGTLHSRSWEVERGTLRLRVERHDLPALAARMLPGEWLLERAERDLLEHHAARAVETEAAPWGAHPGRRLRFEAGDRPGEREDVRIALAGRRIYVLFARGAGEAAPLAKQFAESVEILAE